MALLMISMKFQESILLYSFNQQFSIWMEEPTLSLQITLLLYFIKEGIAPLFLVKQATRHARSLNLL